jgi:hypothetical protein
MNNRQCETIIAVLQSAAKEGIDNRHQALAFYLIKLKRNPSDDSYSYSNRDVKSRREQAIEAFAEFERGVLDGVSINDEQYFEKYILEAWMNLETDEADNRSALQRVIDGDSPR